MVLEGIKGAKRDQLSAVSDGTNPPHPLYQKGGEGKEVRREARRGSARPIPIPMSHKTGDSRYSEICSLNGAGLWYIVDRYTV
jgi:hypothetical protein